METHDNETCEARYESLKSRITVLMWLLVILIGAATTGAGFMVSAARQADSVESQQALAQKEREILALDIERAKVEWGKSLTVAIDKIAQENRFKTQEIMHKLQSIEEKLSVKGPEG